MLILYSVGLIIFLTLIYKIFIEEIKSFKQVVLRGFYFRLLGFKKREIKLYFKTLETASLNEKEYRDLIYLVGIWHVKEKQYVEATQYFDRAFQGYTENFSYNNEFQLVIMAYEKSQQIEKAKKILQFFLTRKSFDKKFQQLESKYHYLLK